IKILDFGIAKVRDEMSMTQTGQGLGTVMFMSPEQINDAKKVGKETDYYSLGMTFAHILMGKSLLNVTKNDSAYAIQTKIINGDLNLSELPKSWKNIIEAAVCLNPEERSLETSFLDCAGERIDKDRTIIDCTDDSSAIPKDDTTLKGGSTNSVFFQGYRFFIILCLLAGLVLLMVGRKYVSVNHEKDGLTGKAFDVTGSKAAFVYTLSSGYELVNAKVGGLENQLIDFITDGHKSANEKLWFGFDQLYFEPRSSVLKPESHVQLTNVVEILKSFSNVQIEVAGFSLLESDSFDMHLCSYRAITVMNTIGELGIWQHRLSNACYSYRYDEVENSAKIENILFRIYKGYVKQEENITYDQFLRKTAKDKYVRDLVYGTLIGNNIIKDGDQDAFKALHSAEVDRFLTNKSAYNIDVVFPYTLSDSQMALQVVQK
ncbi:MAG: protein kinase, partial [Chitinophagales bacterium]|nr:protein kinase [Chitinophagales bacterium]